MNDIKFYVIEVLMPKWRKPRLIEMVGIDLEDAIECCLMEYPNAGVLTTYKEVRS